MSWTARSSDKSWTFSSPTATTGTFYVGGYYDFSGTNDDFSPGAVNWGTANSSYAAHFFVVLGANTVDTITLTITGTSITDAGVRTGADTDTITITHPATTNDYFETAKKFIGQVSVQTTGGTAKDCNYGWCKYWDNNNTDFHVTGCECVWEGGAADAAPDIALLHHKATGWTYNAGADPTPPTALASMNTDHSTESEILNGEHGAWKRTNLTTEINGSGSEGTIVRMVTTANKAFEIATFVLTIKQHT